MSERRDAIIAHAKLTHSMRGVPPEVSPEVMNAIFEGALVKDFNINDGPYFGQIFSNRPVARRDWVASAALYCWPGRHECSGGIVMYTMCGLLSFPTIPEAWHIEFQSGHGLEDKVTICRLIPD